MSTCLASPPAAAGMLEAIARHYTGTVRRHGSTALGVDWLSTPGQRLRFVQLLKLVTDWTQPLTLHDLGCGYGALLDHLAQCHAGAPVRYIGSDISAEMIRRARLRQLPPGLPIAPLFTAATSVPPGADYAVASGIFNVKLQHSLEAWEQHVASTLDALCAANTRGFAVNFMLAQALSARPHAAAFLYGCEPQRWIAYARDVLRCDVEVVAGYGLPEFTLLVRRPS